MLKAEQLLVASIILACRLRRRQLAASGQLDGKLPARRGRKRRSEALQDQSVQHA